MKPIWILLCLALGACAPADPSFVSHGGEVDLKQHALPQGQTVVYFTADW